MKWNETTIKEKRNYNGELENYAFKANIEVIEKPHYLFKDKIICNIHVKVIDKRDNTLAGEEIQCLDEAWSNVSIERINKLVEEYKEKIENYYFCK